MSDNTIAPEREEYETDTFGVGEACGVCIFPTGPGEICGNTVYANEPKGRLPKYCGQEGQAHWQAKYGTEGNPRHKSDLAGYPRKRLGMSAADAETLGDIETERRGITRRLKSDAPAAPVAEVAPAAPAGPVDLAAALPDSPVDALAELARLVAGRVVAVRSEMDELRAAAQVETAKAQQDIEEERAQLEAERAEVETDRAKLAELIQRAETDIREASEARLKAEGELASERRRVAELEKALADADKRRIAEVEEVRRVEREEFRLTMREFATTIRAESEARPVRREVPVTDESVERMAARVARGDVTRSKDGTWFLVNAKAPTPAGQVLDHMMSAGSLVVGEGNPAPVALVRQ